MTVPTPDEILDPVRSVKEAIDQFFPVVLWSPPRTTTPIMALVIPSHGTLMRDLPTTIGELLAVLGPPEWFAVAFDTYSTRDPSLTDHSLADAFHQGHPSVVEQIVLAVAAPNDLRAYRQVYRCTPVDGWEWDPIEQTRERELLAALATVPLYAD